MTDPIPNHLRINNRAVVVRTQAAFNTALKKFSSAEVPFQGGYPKKYPALVVFSVGYRGYHYVDASIIYLDNLQEILEWDKKIVEQLNSNDKKRGSGNESKSSNPP